MRKPQQKRPTKKALAAARRLARVEEFGGKEVFQDVFSASSYLDAKRDTIAEFIRLFLPRAK